MQKLTFFLFDVDGVIVNPLGYRAGITKTLELLFERIGLSEVRDLLPTEAEISRLESVGVHDVWDMTNMIFASVLTSVAQSSKGFALPLPEASVKKKLESIADTVPVAAKPSIELIAGTLAKSPSSHPPDILLALLTEDLKSCLRNEQLEVWRTLLKDFLCGTRNPYESYGTRLFQNVILGSDEFTTTYDLDSEYDGESLLKLTDEVLMSAGSVQKLHELCNSDQSNFFVGVYTARPSHPPQDAPGSTKGYSPEAELALESASMTSFPLVGMGMMEWLAKQKNERTEDLTKPNTTQAISALIACSKGTTSVDVLQEAYAIDKQDKEPADTALGAIRDREVIVYVFEDTISGILPMIAASKRLNQLGFSIEVRPLGIARDAQKREALEEHCLRIFDDVNAAVDFAVLSI